MRYAKIVGDRAHQFIVGNNILDDSSDIATSLVLRDFHGHSLPAPPGDFVFAHPTAVWNDAGKLEMVWGEPAPGRKPRTLSEWMLVNVQSIWTAAFDLATNTWTEPHKIVQGGLFSLGWSSAVSSPARISGHEHRLAALMPISDSVSHAADGRRDARSAIRFFTLGRGVWDVKTLVLPTIVSSAQVAFGRGITAVAYVQPAGRETSANRVIVLWSADAGVTWSPSIVVGETPALSRLDVVSATAYENTLHVVWKQQLPSGGVVMRHRASSDGGGTWSELSDLAVPANTGNETSVIDSCSALHIVFGATGTDGRLQLHHAMFASGHWSQETNPFAPLVAYSARLSRTEDGAVWLSFIGSRQEATSLSAAATYVTRLLIR